MKHLGLFLCAGLLASCGSDSDFAATEPPVEPLGELTATVVIDGIGKQYTVACRVRSSPEERAVGLMYRKEPLGPETGMLFLMEKDADHSFWMRNTLIPLDMLFIDRDGVIVGIVAEASPRSETGRSVGASSRFVLEMDGGWAKAHHVVAGNTVAITLH